MSILEPRKHGRTRLWRCQGRVEACRMRLEREVEPDPVCEHRLGGAVCPADAGVPFRPSGL